MVGIGIDAVEVDRFRRVLGRRPGLAGRLFTDGERAGTGGRDPAPRLAARFAAKEAVAKALGTGIRGFAFLDVEVHSDELGRPLVALHGGAARLAAQLGVDRVHLSLSTGVDLAVANAVLESA